MDKKNNSAPDQPSDSQQSGKNELKNAGDRSVSKEEFQKAHLAADNDIAADPEFSAHSPNDDLDEGETARLGENTSLV